MSPEVVARPRDEEDGYASKPQSVKDLFEVDAGKFPGRGTPEYPFIVDWDLGDPENPYNWSVLRKWMITLQVSVHILLLTSQTNGRIYYRWLWGHGQFHFVAAHIREAWHLCPKSYTCRKRLPSSAYLYTLSGSVSGGPLPFAFVLIVVSEQTYRPLVFAPMSEVRCLIALLVNVS